jgi:hypothetical protein
MSRWQLLPRSYTNAIAAWRGLLCALLAHCDFRVAAAAEARPDQPACGGIS